MSIISVKVARAVAIMALWVAAIVPLQGTTQPPAVGSSERRTTTAANQAVFVAQDVPVDMQAGEIYTVSVTYRNVGTSTWPSGSNYRLGCWRPQDGSLWGVTRIAVADSVNPEGSITFTFKVTPPHVPGRYGFQWRMVQEGVEWFGDPTPETLVRVTAVEGSPLVSGTPIAEESPLISDAPTIVAAPDPVPAGGGPGLTRLRWTTGDESSAEVFVSVDGGPEQLFARTGSDGAADAPWISTWSVYEFRLYSVGVERKLLASVDVTRNHLVEGSIGFLTYMLLIFGTAALAMVVWLTVDRGFRGDGFGSLITVVDAVSGMRRWKWVFAGIATTALFLAANHVLVRGIGVAPSDAERYYYPFHTLVADYARAGRLLYWDPWTNGGVPQLGDPQIAAFSPLNVLTGLLFGGGQIGFIVYWLFLWWLGGVGIFFLGRHLGAPAWATSIVALGYLFSGVYTGQAQHTSIIESFSLLPFIIWRLDAALLSSTKRPAVEAGALWGLSSLGGYPGLTIITGCFAAIWAFGRWLTKSTVQGHLRGLRFTMIALAIVLAIGVTVMSPTYFTFLVEGSGSNLRQGALPRNRVLLENALHPGALASFAGPYASLVKLRLDRGIWPYTGADMSSIYVGALTTMLAMYGVLASSARRWRWWLAAVAIVSLGCAMGQALPLRGWLYDFFPPMRFFRHAAIFRNYYIFAVAVLALLGARDLGAALASGDSRAPRRFTIASLIAASAAGIALATVISTLPHIGEDTWLAKGHAAAVWIGGCLVAAVVWRVPSRARSVIVPAALLVLAVLDTGLTARLSRRTITDTNPAALARWKEFDAKHQPALDLTATGWRRDDASCAMNPPCTYEDYDLRNTQVITKVPVFNSYGANINEFHRTMFNNPILRQMSVGDARVFFSADVVDLKPTAEDFAKFLRRTEELGIAPLIVQEETQRGAKGPVHQASHARSQIESAAAVKALGATIIRYDPDLLEFTIDAPADGWVLLTDRWARGWQADVDRRPVRVHLGNFLFRAVQVSAGKHSIRFLYKPIGLPWLLLASWGTMTAVVIASLTNRLNARRAVHDRSLKREDPT